MAFEADAAYFSPERLLSEALEAFLPPDRIDVAEYAAVHRVLQNEGGGYVGRWQHETAPYVVAPMQELTSLEHLTVAVVGPGQVAKTVIAENWFLESVGNDPGDILWYMQTETAVASYVKSRIDPMIEAHDELKSALGLRPVDDSIHFKRFRSMKVEFLSATHSNFISKSAPRIVGDEIDAYPEGLGDTKALLDIRRQTFGRESMLLAISHPDLARGLDPAKDWGSGIMSIYGDSDRRRWYWPCPHCGAWSSPVPGAARVMTLKYPEAAPLDEIQEAAHLLCPVSGCIIEDKHRRAMNIAAYRSPFGGWIGEGQEISQDGAVSGRLVRRDTAGFWIVGLMSPFIIGGIGGLARAYVKAEREFDNSGDDSTLRQVVVKQIGIPYARPRGVGSVDATVVADRAEPVPIGTVQDGVRFLTVAIDCQIAHFEWLVRGWGVRAESWVVDRGRIPGDPATSPEDWDAMLAALALRTYPLGDGSSRTMAIRGLVYDSGGAPGVTQQAYAAWTRWRRKGVVKSFGRIGGRDVWSVLPLKGASGLNPPPLTVSYPDTARKANVVASSGTVPVGIFAPNFFKDSLAGQLQRALPGDRYIHFPAALRSAEPPHLFFEQLTAEQRLLNGRWEKIQAAARNEALDLMVMNEVAAHLHGLGRIDWTKPPSWAAPWATNAMIAVPTVPAAAPDPQEPAGPGATISVAAAPKRSIASRLA